MNSQEVLPGEVVEVSAEQIRLPYSYASSFGCNDSFVKFQQSTNLKQILRRLLFSFRETLNKSPQSELQKLLNLLILINYAFFYNFDKVFHRYFGHFSLSSSRQNRRFLIQIDQNKEKLKVNIVNDTRADLNS